MAMRVHITLDAELVRELDARVGARRRSGFIARAVERALDDERRWELIESALGTVADEGHEWDADAAAWLHESRRGDPRRVG
jgi:metal-responsive CopG/Arc/MetJ family transcriptional regulator